MTMRKLGDPILNDLLLMVQGRRAANLSGQAITRYVQHLDRLDRELAAVRAGSGISPAGVHDEVIEITRRQFNDLEAEIKRLAALNQMGVSSAEETVATKSELARLENYLLTERTADLTDGSAIDNAIRLLRDGAGRRDEDPDESEEPDDAAASTGPATRAAAGHRRSGPTNRRA